MANQEQVLRLKTDIKIWNKWRAKNSNTKIDLKNADLRGINLRGANLKYANIENADLRHADIRGTKFTHANLFNAKLQYTKCGIEPKWKSLILYTAFLLPLLTSIIFASLGRLISISDNLLTRANFTASSLLLLLPSILFLCHRKEFQGVIKKLVTINSSARKKSLDIFANSKKKYKASLLPANLILVWLFSIIGPTTIIIFVCDNPLGLILAIFSFIFHTLPYVNGQDGKILSNLVLYTLLLNSFIFYLDDKYQNTKRPFNKDFGFLQAIREYYVSLAIKFNISTCFYRANLEKTNLSFSYIAFSNFQGATINKTEFYRVSGYKLAHFNKNFYLCNLLLASMAMEYEKLEIDEVSRPKTIDLKHPHSRDLSQLNITKVNFGKTFLHGNEKEYVFDLRKTDFDLSILEDVDFSFALLYKSSFKGATLRNIDFTGANLKEVDFEGAILEDSVLVGASLDRCNFRGAKFQNASLKDLDFTNCKFDRIIFIESDLANSYFWETEFKNSVFQRSNLTGSNFSRASLVGADLSMTNLEKANMQNADLRYSNFDRSNLSGANLHRSKSSNTCFNHTICVNVDFGHADISESSFLKADLRKANFVAAQALGANFSQANLTAACISDWQIGSSTVFSEVVCNYIFRTFKQGKYSDRLPIDSNRFFASGEFAQRFQILASALETIDITFTDGIDWKAFFRSFQELRLKRPEENIAISGIERKGDAFIVRLEVNAKADKSSVETEIKQLYANQLAALEAQYEERLRLQSEEIAHHRKTQSSLLHIVETMAEKDSISQIFYGPVGNVAGTNYGTMTAYINQNSNDISRLLSTLRETAQQFPEAQKDEALMELEDLETDLKALNEQEPERIRKRLQRLIAVGTAAATVAGGAATFSGNINEFTGNVLELAEKVGLSRDAVQGE